MLSKTSFVCYYFQDSIESSHPVSVPVNHPDEINEIFDDISYKKGGSLIRMMANFLGVEVFNRGIEHYLKKHKYGNAQQVNICFLISKVCYAFSFKQASAWPN